MLNNPYQNRKYVVSAIIVGVVLVYVVRLFSLQVVETKYKEGAESNALLHRTLYAPRGLIYDRDGRLLVYNKPAYDINVIMREVQQLDTLELCRTLGIDRAYFDGRMADIKNRRKNRGYSPYTPQTFMSQLEMEDVAAFQQLGYKFPGFYLQNRTLREYAYPSAAHVLGSIGEVSPRQLEEDDYYRQGDYAGRDGIEYVYEKELRGENGVEILLRDARGRIQGRYEDGRADIVPRAGQEITLSLDMELQQLGERLLTGKVGSIVAIEPATGEILAMVSNPAFDPGLLVGRERSKNYAALVADTLKPLLNRATQAQYSPGSTFKIIQALTCLDMGGITPSTLFSCQGQLSYPIKCTHTHDSPADLCDAIEQSCNPYFWQAYRNTLELDGYGEDNEPFKRRYDTWEGKVRSFGLGSRLPDTDIYEQLAGYVPSRDRYDKTYGPHSWKAMTVRSLSIGQGELLVTPLQIANVAATIANEGYYVTPHLRRADSLALRTHRVDVDPKHFPVVKEGMKRVLENTVTGRYYRVPGLEMGGKTGTVQNPHGKDHALFMGFAPLDDPQIAIAVVVENAGFGATYAMPVATLMTEYYVQDTIRRTWLLDYVTNTITNPDVIKGN